jgi:hypothetical protein
MAMRRIDEPRSKRRAGASGRDTLLLVALYAGMVLLDGLLAIALLSLMSWSGLADGSLAIETAALGAAQPT